MTRAGGTIPATGHGAAGETALREMVLRFLAAQVNPVRWTFFTAAVGVEGGGPDLILDVGGRIAYVDLKGQGCGGLGRAGSIRHALAGRRGAMCFVVRSLPEMERVLGALGVRLTPKGEMAADAAENPEQWRRRHG